MISWVAYLSIGILIGFATGFYFSILNGSEKNRLKELESKLDQAKNEQNKYEQDVTSHFLKTSNLINNMTDSYRAIYDHMSDGAKTLCSQSLIDSPASQYQLDIPVAKLIGTESKTKDSEDKSAANNLTEENANEVSAQVESPVHEAIKASSINEQMSIDDKALDKPLVFEESTESAAASNAPSFKTSTERNTITKNGMAKNLEKKMLYEKNKKQDSTVVH